jgi:serine/threonine protein kinase
MWQNIVSQPENSQRMTPATAEPPVPVRASPPTVEAISRMMPIGRYSVQKQVGMGGMGTVYRGTQLSLGRPVAIKVLRVSDGYDFAFEDRFRREAKAMALLNHPNIVAIYDYGHLGSEFLYFVMEFVDGMDMGEIMRQGRMTPELALQLLPQICAGARVRALQGHRASGHQAREHHAHASGRGEGHRLRTRQELHRDLVAGHGDAHGHGHARIRVPGAVDAHREVDHRADIYAVGVMMYQMLTGALPRGSWLPPSRLRAGIDPRFDAIVTRAMMQERAQRFQSIAEMRQAIDTVLNQPATQPLRPPTTAGNAKPKAASLRILLLEDDLLVRDLLRRTLESAKFEVHETGDGKDTLRLYQEAMQTGKPYDIVILDLTIPDGMCGRETMMHLRRIDPHLLAIVSSGYKDDPVMQDSAAYGFAAALPKPYQREALIQLVTSVLALGRQKR